MTDMVKPCPFCGSEQVQFKFCLDYNYRPVDFLECGKCCARSGYMFFQGDTNIGVKYDKCLDVWNTRYKDDKLNEGK